MIGGFIGLTLGPEVLGSLLNLDAHSALGRWMQEYEKSWISDYRLLPGILITPVMAASVLGMRIPTRSEFIDSVGKQLGYAVAFYGLQFALGGLAGAMFASQIYPTFGLELFAGFSGGHGTSALYGQTLQGIGATYWELGQGVAVTAATYGLLLAVVGGIALINFCARRGETALISSPSKMPAETLTGLYVNPEKRSWLGRSVTEPDVLEPLSYTFALIAIPTLLGILVRQLFIFWGTPALELVGDYAWALIFATTLWLILDRRGLSWLLDVPTKNRLAGTLVDFLVVAAIVSLPLRAVIRHILPILFMLALGTVMALAMFHLGKKIFTDYWVERCIMTFGQCTGVTATGLLLLRIVDPDFKTPAVSAWGLAYAISFPLALIFLGLGASFVLSFGHWAFTGISLVITVAALGLSFLIPKPADARTLE